MKTSLIPTAVILTLQLVAQHQAESATTRPVTTHPTETMNKAIDAIVAVARRNESVRQLVGLRRPGLPLLVLPSGKERSQELVNLLGSACDDSVRGNGWYPAQQFRNALVDWHVEGHVFEIDMTYPAHESADSRHTELTLNIWVCDDAESASAVLWLLQNSFYASIRSPLPETIQKLPHDQGCGPLAEKEAIGDASFICAPDRNYSLPLEEKDGRIKPTRLGFLSGNAVVQASVTIFRKGDKGWYWGSLSDGEKARLLATLEGIEKSFRTVAINGRR